MHVHSRKKLNQLRRLRHRGCSIQELSKELNMPKTTVWYHVQKISLTPRYLEILRKKQGGSRNRSEHERKKASEDAHKYVSSLNSLHKMLIAVSLYWGEGSKGDFSLSNTDPKLIKTFVSCLEDFGIYRDRLSIHIRLYEDIDKNKAIQFWSGVIGVVSSRIKSVNILSGKKKGKLKYGMCRLRVTKGGYYLKLFRAIQDRIFERLTCPRSSKDRAPHS